METLRENKKFVSPRYKPLFGYNVKKLEDKLEKPSKRLLHTSDDGMLEQDIRIKQLLPDFVADQSHLDSISYQDHYDTAYSKAPYSNKDKEGDDKLGHCDVSVTYTRGVKHYQLRMNIRVNVTGFDECEVTILLLDIYDMDTKEIINF